MEEKETNVTEEVTEEQEVQTVFNTDGIDALVGGGRRCK